MRTSGTNFWVSNSDHGFSVGFNAKNIIESDHFKFLVYADDKIEFDRLETIMINEVLYMMVDRCYKLHSTAKVETHILLMKWENKNKGEQRKAHTELAKKSKIDNGG